jgi:hypothetical protein
MLLGRMLLDGKDLRRPVHVAVVVPLVVVAPGQRSAMAGLRTRYVRGPPDPRRVRVQRLR